MSAGGEAPQHAAGPEPTIFYLVKQLELAVRAELDQALRPHEVTVPQYTALTVLRNHDGLSAAKLARRSFVTPQSMADIVDALVARGLLVREDDPANRRHRLLRLTSAGEALLAGLDDAAAQLEAKMLTHLTSRSQVQLRRHLLDCRRALTG